MLHVHPISKYPPHKEETSNPAALITWKGANRDSIISSPLLAKLLPYLLTEIQNSTFWLKNANTSRKKHTTNLVPSMYGGSPYRRREGGLSTPLGHTLLSSNKNASKDPKSNLHSSYTLHIVKTYETYNYA
jgi:hypothetical protein